MGERFFLVVDQTSVEESTRGGVDDHRYRRLPLRGVTYRESSLRHWAADSFSVPSDASIDTIADAAGNGGWTVFEARGTQPSPKDAPKGPKI